MRKVFAALATVLALAIVAQFYLAAASVLDPAPTDESFQTHRALGYGIVLFAVLLTGVAALARMPGRLIGLTGLVAGLGVLQGVLRVIAAAVDDGRDTGTNAGQLVFGLHAVNGLIMLALAVTVTRRAVALSRPAESAPGRAGARSARTGAHPR
jgi:hypothetical protein